MKNDLARIADALERIARAMEIEEVEPAETCGVRDAARMLCTTPGGIYAMNERGMLPRSIGPGRRLVFRRADLLQLASENVGVRRRARFSSQP